MSPKELITHFKTLAATARAFRIAPASVSEWVAKGNVPIDRQCQAEVMTHGVLRANREELGPLPRDGHDAERAPA